MTVKALLTFPVFKNKLNRPRLGHRQS